MVYRETIVKAVEVTTSDSADNYFDGIRHAETSAKNIAVQFLDGTSFTFTAIPAGATIKCKIKKVLATGTTSTRVEGLIFE